MGLLFKKNIGGGGISKFRISAGEVLLKNHCSWGQKAKINIVTLYMRVHIKKAHTLVCVCGGGGDKGSFEIQYHCRRALFEKKTAMLCE